MKKNNNYNKNKNKKQTMKSQYDRFPSLKKRQKKVQAFLNIKVRKIIHNNNLIKPFQQVEIVIKVIVICKWKIIF